MVVQLLSGEIFGIDGRVVEIEVDLQPGVSQFVVSGLAGKGIRDGRERIRAAILNSGFRFPRSFRVVVNLAPPASDPNGAAFDLPIALAIVTASGQVRPRPAQGWGVLGELSLDGGIRSVPGTLALVRALRERGIETPLVPVANLEEARAVPGVHPQGVENLAHAAAVLEGRAPGIHEVSPGQASPAVPPLDFSQVIGHEAAKRALTIAAAGRHNVLLIGPPGAGKSLLARCLPGLLPSLSDEEKLEVTQIHATATPKSGLVGDRPFRAPHHTISWAGLVGGGSVPRAGEITLAHGGVLFLDELPEFPRRSLEALREPLEEGAICIARAQASITFPARFLLVTAMNPCPCGNAFQPKRRCRCSADRVRRYLEKISLPLLDRIDIRLEIQSPEPEEIFASRSATGTCELRERVEKADAFRRADGRDLAPRLAWSDRKRWAPLRSPAESLLSRAAREDDLSTRALTRVLRLARTVADGDGRRTIAERHVLEALHLHRPPRRDGFAELWQRW